MSLKPCTHYFVRKKHQASFYYRIPQRKANILDGVYYDVCGMMTTNTLGGVRSFVTFIDDCSKKVWAYALKNKDQVFYVFK